MLTIIDNEDGIVIENINTNDNNGGYEDYIFDKEFKLELDYGHQELNSWYYDSSVASVNCLTGRNGTGKSTILERIEKFYISKGAKNVIFYDQNNLRVNGIKFDLDINVFELYNYIENSFDKSLNEKLANNINLFNKEMDSRKQLLWNNAFSSYDISNIEKIFKYKITTQDSKNELTELIREKSIKASNSILVEKNDKVMSKWNILNKYFDEYQVDIGVSLGELSRLRLYVNIERAIKHLGEKYDETILLLDEPDANFHPEWSRTFLSDTIKHLSCVSPQNKHRIILTTHSPLVIADVPKSGINYLNIVENKVIVESKLDKTMGLELNSLFKNLFYLDDERGEIFTTRYMELVDSLMYGTGKENVNSNTTMNEKIEFMKSNISDPVLKNTLLGLAQISTNTKFKERINVKEK